jgi:hypothetical protein
VVGLAQYPDQHGPKRPVLLAVDQQLRESAGSGVPLVAAEPLGAVEVGEHEDVEQFGAGCGTKATRRSRSICSSSGILGTRER